MSKKKYDFGGYVTRNDLRCSDGRTIRHGAFADCDGKTVPLVWQHMHDSPDNVLGHALLENRDDGVYGYCSFNNTPFGIQAKGIVEHGDISSLSIYANKLKQQGGDVIHGVIREVSLVLAGANPGAFIDNLSFSHGDGTYDTIEDEAVIYSGTGIMMHADEEDDEKPASKQDDSEDGDDGETVEDVFNTLTEKQKNVVYAIIGAALEGEGGQTAQHADDEGEAADDSGDGETVEDVFNTLSEKQKNVVYAIIGAALEGEGGEATHYDYNEGDFMKYNVFDEATNETDVLTHSDMEAIIEDAKRNGSLKDAALAYLNSDSNALAHGITDIEILFPEAQMVGGNTPGFIQRRTDWVNKVMNGVHKSPFARVKSNAANITMEEARARGYIKGHQKAEEQFTVMKRTTDPTTIYKLQKLDRDDIVDITDFDVIAWMKGEMRMMLDEEIARAILVGDGRSPMSDDKIPEDHIRPIWTDEEVFAEHTVLAKTTTTTDIIDAIIRMKKAYRGSGQPTMFIGTDLLTEMRLLKDGDGYRRYKNDSELADDLRVKDIVEIELLDGLTRTVNGKTRTLGAIIVNLNDYNCGANKGGQVTLFDDFDLNFNKYEYLIETRMSGALYQPKSALVLEFADQALPNMYVTGTPTANPKTEGFYEKEGIIYVPTRDTTVVSGKTYYELA